ncbi:endo-alpha-N-acetylgalactosaminidase family protein [Parabacteroides faecis]|uniref:Endo-alpha-N-acetylgalactosaminidase domain-containing protein n=1 Tax=Parabacteroides faecis TaxID=1217282 RepID=A0ABR6KID2_9BACT|nr:endo-alpha-N-acetylgalactosaminidase family protein [Parabacteroides faecis]MBB4621261.1 hypothetical protein [Parabacteroides faecis]
MKTLFYILITLFCLSCSMQNKLEEITIRLDKETLNPVRNPGERGTLHVTGRYSNGKTTDLPLSDIALSVRTVSASGNVEVIALSGDQLIPKDGGLAEVTAVYQKDGATYQAKKRVVVAPYYRDYHQTLVLKLFMGYDGELNEPDPNNVIFQHEDPSRLCTFGHALDVVKRVDNLTRGIPKIIYLVGWQRGGHDHLYPDWSIVNPKLKREEDATALESLRWLIREARAYNTTISLHINMVDAFEESPLWDTYIKNDIIARDANGNLKSIWEYVKGHKAYHLSYTKEWEKGFAKPRIDHLIDMIPELKDGHTIHIDAFMAYWQPENRPLSPWHAKPENGGIDIYKEVETQRKIFKYWREKGFDVTGEGIFWAHPAGEGFVGLQPMSWWFPDDKNFQMEIPERLSARGRTHREGQGDFRFGSSMQGEEIFQKDLANLPGFLSQFCTMTLPWYYLSRLERVAFVDEALYYSEGVIARVEDGKNIIRKGDFILRENDNLFVPALWNDNEIIAYSGDGYESHSWLMPEGWEKVGAVDVYSISMNEPARKLSAIPVDNGLLKLALGKGEAVSIVPAGQSLTR